MAICGALMDSALEGVITLDRDIKLGTVRPITGPFSTNHCIASKEINLLYVQIGSCENWQKYHHDTQLMFAKHKI